MFLREAALLEPLATRPRIIELAVPLSHTRQPYKAVEAIAATFASTNGAISEKAAFDLYIDAPLTGAAVLGVHSEGRRPFARDGTKSPGRVRRSRLRR